ncbi:MAG: autotransporter domain-containing protein [Desulfobulbus sp.]
MKTFASFFALLVFASPSLAEFTPDAEFYNQPALSAVNLLPAYNAGLSGAGVRVGVVDSGINPNHVEFANAIVAGYDSFANRSGTSDFSIFLQDYFNHGTFVASVLAARLDGAARSNNIQGVAFNSSLVIGGMNFVADDSVNARYIASSLNYASSQSTKVINNSWEFTSGTDDSAAAANYQNFATDYSIVISAIKTALDRGSVLIFTTGNEAVANPGTPAIVPFYDSDVAAKGGFIVVAASTNDGTSLASYSNRCGISKEYCITAPGGDSIVGLPLSATEILGADRDSNTGYFLADGTSAAAPIVSGAVALVAEQFPWMTNKNLSVTILTTGNRAAHPDDEWGRGLLDVGKAIKGPALFEEDFEANVPSGSSVFSNDIGYRAGLDGGLVKLGAGTLTLTGADTYTGTTSINAGTLVVNGSLVSPVTVAIGGTLRGTGSLSDALTVNGTLSPGDSVGTLTVASMTMNAGSTFCTKVASTYSYGKLNVGGMAVLPDNANIVVDVIGSTYNTSGKLDNIISAGTLNSNGTFNVADNSLLFNFGVIKDGNTVDLTVVHDTTVKLQNIVANAGNRSAIGAARVIDSELARDPTSSLAGMFGGFSDGQETQLSNALSQTLPLLAGESTLVAQSVLGRVNRIVQARQDGVNGLSSGDPFFGDKEMWIKPFGSWAEQHDQGGVSGYSANTGGIALGVDAATSPASRLGFAFAYANSNVTGNSSVAPNDATINSYQLLGYGSHKLDKNTELTCQSGIGANATNGHRTLSFASGTAGASYHSLTATAGIGLEKTVKLNAQTSFLPSIHVDYTWIKDRAYRETGSSSVSPLLLNVDDRRSDELILGVNSKINHKLNSSTTVNANAGVGYDVINNNTAILASYAGAPGASFTTYGIDQSPWQAHGGLELVHKTKTGMEISVCYDAEYRSDLLSHSASAKLSWAF